MFGRMRLDTGLSFHPKRQFQERIRPMQARPRLRLLSNHLSHIRNRQMIRPAQQFKRNMGLSLGL
jgi:hypothetical protein